MVSGAIVIKDVNIKSIYFFYFRVLETVQSVPTFRMDCSVCPAVPKACQERMTPWCGNTLMREEYASCATRTAPRGKYGRDQRTEQRI